MKRLLSMILVLTILVGMLPLPVSATESNTEITNDDVTVEGTNGFGNLLSDDIQTEYDEEMQYSSGYGVTDLTIVGNTAVVEYHTLEEATLVVAIYSEDKMQMITSGKAQASPDFTEATVTIAGTMPEYFHASAYLVDNYDYSPLCEAYDTPMYTRSMQDLLDATVDDFDPQRVFNLDDDKTTNFAVFADGTSVLEEQAGVNTVVSVNDDTMTYIIENADENITGLQPGDILAYPYGDNNILIVKVASISLSGTTATIAGAELEMEEVFSHVKVEASGDSSNVTVDESTGDGITYTGMGDSGSTYDLRNRAWEGEGDGGLTLNFDIEKGEYKVDDKESWEVNGTISLKFSVKFSYYVTLSDYFIKFDIDNTITIQSEVQGKHVGKLAKFPTFGFSPVAGVYFGFEPILVMNFELTFQFKAVYTDGVSFHFEKNEPVKRYSKKPTVDTSLEVEGKFFFGVDLQPKVKIIDGTIAEITLSALAGVEITAKATGKLHILGSEERGDTVHDCNVCIDGKAVFKLEFSVKISFLKMKKLTFNFKLALLEIKLGSLYFSSDKNEFGWGSCPYKRYQTIFIVKSQDGKVLPDHKVYDSAGEVLGVTDKNGQVIKYLPNGTYDVSAIIEGNTVKQRAIILDKAKRVLIRSGVSDQPTFGIFGTIDTVTITDYGEEIAGGNCGPLEDGVNSDAVTWTLYENGALILLGDGEIMIPEGESWQDYAYQIYHLAICDGITGIAEKAFYNLPVLEELVIADSVTNWGNLCFGDCTALKDVVVPVDYPVSIKIPDKELENLLIQTPFDGCCSVETIQYTYGATGIMADRDGSDTYWNGSYYRALYFNVYTMEFDSRETLKHVTFDEGITHIGAHAFTEDRYTLGPEGALETFEIPSTVTSIGTKAVYNHPNLKFVSLPDGLTSLKGSNFSYCGLEEITLPSTLTSIPGSVFCGTNIKTLEIPDSVTKIGDYAFTSSKKLEMVVLPDSLQTIGENAFSECSALKELKIPASVTHIGAFAFRYCDKLEKVNFPDSAITIGNDAFSGCASLEKVEILNSNAKLGDDTFSFCNNLKEVTVRTAALAEGAFSSCQSLKKITVPVDYKRYSSRPAFEDCSNVEHIVYTPGKSGVLPNFKDIHYSNINYNTSVEYYACNSLKKVEFEEGVTDLGGNVFDHCTVLETVILPYTIRNLSAELFQECTSLRYVLMSDDEANTTFLNEISASSFAGCTALEKVEIPASVTNIGDHAFADCENLKSIEVPASVETIGVYAFENCSKLVSAIIRTSQEDPSLLTEIPNYVFLNCSSLESIVLPNTVESIGYRAFETCTALESVTFAEEMQRPALHTIKSSAFKNCSSLKTMDFAATVSSLGTNVFEGCSSLTKLIIPENIKELPEETFMNCISLTELVIPEHVTAIGFQAFACCTGLTRLVLPESVPELGSYCFAWCSGLKEATIPVDYSYSNYAFYDCENVEFIRFTPGKTGTMVDSSMYHGALEYESAETLKEVVFEEGVSYIREYAFYDCEALTSVRFPSTLVSIGKFAFSYCSLLREIDLSDTLLTEIPHAAFEACSNLEKVKLPDSLQSIGKYALSYLHTMESITIPDNVEILETGALSYCENLLEVDLPSSMKVLGDNVFEHCSKLSEITLPASLETLGNNAFGNCYDLKKITITSDIGAIADDAFHNIDANVYYPADSEYWTEDNMLDYGGYLSWIPYTVDENGDMVIPTEEPEFTQPEEAVATQQIESPDVTETVVPETTISEISGETCITEEIFPKETAAETIPEETAPETTEAQETESTSAKTVPEGWELLTEPEPLTEETTPKETVSYVIQSLSVRTVLEPVEESKSITVSQPAANALIGGNYSSEMIDDSTYVKVASFKDLVPGEQYVLLVLKSLESQDPLGADNLLYISQAAADEDGKLEFRYIPKEDLNVTYVVACGAANQSLNDAVITIPEMTATGDLQAVEPIVMYKGKQLVEDQDYTLLGQLSAAKPGEYTFYIRGIYHYSGLVACKYTILPPTGDLDCDGFVTVTDVQYLIWHTLFPEMYALDKTRADFDNSGDVTDVDAVTLIWYILFPEIYPL